MVYMVSTFWNIVKKGKEKLTTLDSKLNFTIPKNIVSYYGINWKKDDRNLRINPENFRFQIWKMDKDNETIYTREFLSWALEYLVNKTKYWDKIIIQIRRDLADTLNNEDDTTSMKHVLSYEEEKKEIEKILKKYFKESKDKVEIVNVSSQYPELFSLLKTQWRRWLDSNSEVTLDPKHFTALDIAKYLYGVATSDIKFLFTIYGTKTEEQRAMDTAHIWGNESDYYALVEVAIRLYEILTWITIQWWVIRQTRYDKIIWMILYGKDSKDKDLTIKRFPWLKDLHEFCNKVAPKAEFDRLYIDNNEIKKVADKQIEKTKTNKKIRNVAVITLAALLGILWWSIGTAKRTKEKMEQEKKEKSEKVLQELLQDARSDNVYFDGVAWHYQWWIESIVEASTNTLYAYFIEFYWSGDAWEKEIKILQSLIKQYFCETDATWKLTHIDDIYDHFLSIADAQAELRAFVNENKLVLTDLGFDLIPYKTLQKHTGAAKYTLNLEWDIQWYYSRYDDLWLNIQYDSTKYQKEFDIFLADLKERNAWALINEPEHTFAVRIIGNYFHSNGKNYEVIVAYDDDDNEFLLAYEKNEEDMKYFDMSKYCLYSKTNWALVAKDFLDHWSQ